MRRLTSILMLVLAGSAHAESDAMQQRLLDQLRQTTLQLRQVQDENAELKSKLDAANGRLAARPAAAPQAHSEDPALRRKLAVQTSRSEALEQQLAQTQKVLAEWKQGYGKAVDVARARDADAKKYEALYKASHARATACTADNAQLVTIADELVSRYKGKGVIEALRDNEPLTGIHRVSLEKLAQTYHDKVVDATVVPPSGDSPP
jgi:hypothetical protein